ncbi:MAG: tetratricopeptide repeat protein, partial [Acidobacteria bacterium]|nr:tetratricopeptide repeat protein [Acidobacteriota bacterium]
MSARDMVRFGLLYLYKGQWGPQRLLSAAYVAQSTSRVSDCTWEPGGYGYMWWLHDPEPFRTLEMYSAMGNGGHTIDVIPGAELVCVHRVNTYEEGHLVSLEQYYRLLRLLLDARVGAADSAPALMPLTASARMLPPALFSAAPRAAYCMEVPVPGWGHKIAIFEEEGRLWVNLGEGPVPLHPLGVDHFLAEDYDAHLYFETAPNGAKTLIDVYLLLQQGRVHLAQGQLDAALAVYDKAARYYPDKPYVYQALAEAYWHQTQPALASAVRYYRRRNALRPQETLDRSLLAWELITLQADIMPPVLSPAHLARLAGSYGPRRVVYVNGHLLYSRDGRPPVQLIPLTDTMFALEGNPATRLRFDVDAAGRVFRITGLSRSGLRDETFRDA